MTTVAVTGVSGYLGRKLVEVLDSTSIVSRIVGIDTAQPGFTSRKLEFYRMDVRAPELGDVLTGCDALVHLAFVSRGQPDELRDVNVGGTRLAAESAVAAGIRRVIFASSTLAYGAHPDNDFPLTESSPLRPLRDLTYSAHKAEAEDVIGLITRMHPEMTVTVLRLCPVAGPTLDGTMARTIEAPYTFGIRGYDVPVQVLHEDDAAAAFAFAVDRDLSGVYNVCPDDWIDAPRASDIVGQRRVELDRERAYKLVDRLSQVGVAAIPVEYLPFVMYPWVASNAKIRDQGFRCERSTEAALAAGAEARRGWVSVGRVSFRPRRAALIVASLGAVALGSAARRSFRREKA